MLISSFVLIVSFIITPFKFKQKKLKINFTKVNFILLEDTPINYIDQLIKQVLSKQTIKQLNKNKISVIDFNNKRKKIDKMRVDKNGNKLSNNNFKEQALNYFNSKYNYYSEYLTIINNALDNYLILEGYFNY